MNRLRFLLTTTAAAGLAFSSHTAFAQTKRPDGFFGVTWGSSLEEAKTALTTRGLQLPEEASSGMNDVMAKGGKFAGQEAESWKLEFVDGRFAAGSVTLRAVTNGNMLYRDLKQMLMTKYGPITAEKKVGDAPARPRNGPRPADNRGTAAIWRFNPNLNEKSKVSISCEVHPAPEAAATAPDGTVIEVPEIVVVRYTNETLYANKAKEGAGANRVDAAKPIKGEDL